MTRSPRDDDYGTALLEPEAELFVSLDDTRESIRGLHEYLERGSVAAGDLDARWDLAEVSGEETPAGSTSTPDQSLVDQIGEALGVRYQDGEELWCGEKELERDRHRWELDPASAEDYRVRMYEEGMTERPSHPILHMRHGAERPHKKR